MRRPALALPLLAALVAPLAVACLGDMTRPVGGTPGPGGGVDAGIGPHTEGLQPPDLGPSSGPDDLAPRPIARLDLAGADLAGLTDCFGYAVCDATTMFCIRYHDGDEQAPGKMPYAPSCYQPTDTCDNMGQGFDCGCIQNDPVLGIPCQGSCVDNNNGTFDCYARPVSQ